MKIAVLSGKGGTGKTFVSVNLASVVDDSTYIDCDVEEPNGHLFFQPVWLKTEHVYRKLPSVDKDKCRGCRVCTEFCKFNALAYIADQVLVFDEVCHSCGGCVTLCPAQAISEKNKLVGEIRRGMSLSQKVISGRMEVGEASGIPLIHGLLDGIDKEAHVIIDCPPGSACSVMESIKEAEYCILVAEPTIFGSHNLAMVHELVELYEKPYGVVLNKCTDEENPSKKYCEDHGIKILSEIPYDDELAALQSNGRIPVRENERFRHMFLDLLNRVYVEKANRKFKNKEDHHEANLGS